MLDVTPREGTLAAGDGIRLRTLRWGASHATGRAIAFVHGYFEHSGRYREIAEHFAIRGYTCCAMDLRGHGHSEGVRGHVTDFSSYSDDLGRLLSTIREEPGVRDIFLVGHSVGGLIALAYAIGRTDLSGVAVSSPYLRNAVPLPGPLLAALPLVAPLAPKLKIRGRLAAATVSRDPSVVAAYASDPLVFRHITLGWALAAVRAQRATLDRAPRLELPLLVMAAGADRVADPSAAREFYERAGSRDKTLLWYDDHYHENFNEPDRQRVYEDLEHWLAQR